jgi:excinuclease ABC subunit C
MADQDVVAVARDDANAIAQVFFVREGRVIGREHFPLAGAEDEPLAEVISSFLLQFYEGSGQVPGEVIVPVVPTASDALEEWLTSLRGARVRIVVPPRGRTRGLRQIAVENAADTLRAMDAWQGEESGLPGALAELQTALDLPRVPLRIECFDISTLQGTNTVGSMVVFQDGATARSDYRRFRIRSAPADDDFACLEEVLGRRFTRLERYRSGGESVGAPVTAFERTPDLVVIDGGKGQLAIAETVLSRMGMDDIPLASLAKRNEELYRPGSSTAVRLPQDSAALHLVQRLRDEAHRFAITYHRSLRRSAGMASSLDDIPGIGSRRRRALLSAFGSLEAIRAASVDELAAVPTMTRSIAEKVKASL